MATAPSVPGGGAQVNISQWGSMPETINSEMTNYRSYMNTAYQADQDAMTQEEDRLRDQMDGGWSDNTKDDLRNFKEEIEGVWNEAKEHWNSFKSTYDDTFRSHVSLAVPMDDKNKDWQSKVYEKLGTFEQQLAQSQIAQSWTGEGAEGYIRQLGPQTTAMADVKRSADGARNGMESSSLIQQMIYISIWQSVKQVHSGLKDMSVSNTDNIWAERIYYMRDNNLGLKNWINEFKSEIGSDWGAMQGELLGLMSQTREGNTELTVANWPAATAASEGYEPRTDGGGAPTPPTTTPPGTTQPEQPQGPVQNTGNGGYTGNQGGSGQTADQDNYE